VAVFFYMLVTVQLNITSLTRTAPEALRAFLMADGQKVVASTPKTTRNAPDLFYAYASLIHITA
ncbi:hypothetical protein, partial [Klebsiella pneumoniae]|jgi:hypothetical protein